MSVLKITTKLITQWFPNKNKDHQASAFQMYFLQQQTLFPFIHFEKEITRQVFEIIPSLPSPLHQQYTHCPFVNLKMATNDRQKDMYYVNRTNAINFVGLGCNESQAMSTNCPYCLDLRKVEFKFIRVPRMFLNNIKYRELLQSNETAAKFYTEFPWNLCNFCIQTLVTMLLILIHCGEETQGAL